MTELARIRELLEKHRDPNTTLEDAVLLRKQIERELFNHAPALLEALEKQEGTLPIAASTRPDEHAGDSGPPDAWLHEDQQSAYVITDRVKGLWLASWPKQVEHYTIPLYRDALKTASEPNGNAVAVPNALREALAELVRLDEFKRVYAPRNEWVNVEACRDHTVRYERLITTARALLEQGK